MTPSCKKLPPLYTRTGDDGTTDLSAGRRVRKDEVHVVACGDIDELNSFIGFLAVEIEGAERTFLQNIQHQLLCAGALVAGFGSKTGIRFDEASDHMEQRINELQLQADRKGAQFVLPGGCRAAALAHVCRTVCRRAERSVWAAADAELRPAAVFLNRLSDYLFALALNLNHFYETAEIKWKKKAHL